MPNADPALTAAMKVVYSPRQAGHNPAHQINASGVQAYPETPARVEAILAALQFPPFERVEPEAGDASFLYAVHAPDYIEYLRTAHAKWSSVSSSPELFASSFVPRGCSRRPEDIRGLAGWYCADTYTTIVESTFDAALASAETAVGAARLIVDGERAAYALCRPPGHHAGPDYCGGFCFLNNAALAAEYLVRQTGGRVSVLDLDYHHGNGTQHIFYESAQVQFVSIHADPAHEYPYFSGYRDETGSGPGAGTTLNLPIPTGASEQQFMAALTIAVEAVARFGPDALVVSFGADVCQGDPEGSFELTPDSLGTVGSTIASTALPTLIVQEGGYVPDVLARSVGRLLGAFAR